MKYSFVLPAYKAAFLRESIDSILSQTYKDFELIIVNDASPEDLTSIVNSYQDERIQYYVNEKNVGGTDLVAQWNHCITYAIGEYLILASDDDVYHPDYLGKMDVLVDKYPNVNVFRPRVQEIDAKGIVVGESGYLDEYLSYIDFLYERCKGKVSSGIPFYLFKRKELVNIRGFVNFPTAWVSDDATVICLAKNGVVTHNEALFAFRMSGLNISSKLNSSRMLYNKLMASERFWKWYGNELKDLNIGTSASIDKITFIRSTLNRNSKLDGMAQLITVSEKEAVLACWSLLNRLETLSFSERLIICYRACKLIVLNNLKSYARRFKKILG